MPNQHGAWAMLVVPFAVGAVASGVTWRHLPLLLAWLVGYFAFFATGLWLRSRCRPRYWPPVRAYGLAAGILGIVVLVLDPGLLRWALAYLPLIVASLWFSWRRADRSVTNDVITVVAACLMAVVVADVGRRPADSGTYVIAGLLLLYFVGTVLYVKTMIRDRGNRGRYVLCVAFHALACVPAFLAGPWVGVLFVALAVRAGLVPRVWPRMTPAVVGVGEILASASVTALLLLTLT